MRESNQIGLEFLLIDMAAALTMLDVAETTSSEKTRARTRRNAWLAYESVLHFCHGYRFQKKSNPSWKPD